MGWRERGDWVLAQWRGALVIVTLILVVPLFIWDDLIARMGGVTILMVVFWVFGTVNLAVTALIPIVLYPLLGIATAEEVASMYFNDSIFLFVGGFLIAIAMEKWNLHKRVSMAFLLNMGTNPRLLLLGFMSITFFLSMWMNNTATTLIMVPLVIHLLKEVAPDEHIEESQQLKNVDKKVYGTSEDGDYVAEEGEELAEAYKVPIRELHHQFVVSMLLGIAYSSTLGGVSTIVGAAPNLAFHRIFTIIFPQAPSVTFLQWSMYAFPMAFVFVVLVWVFFAFIWCFRMGYLVFDTQGLRKSYRDLGPLRYEEGIILIVFLVTVVLWFTRAGFDSEGEAGWGHWFGGRVGDGTVAMMMSLLLFFIPSSDYIIPEEIDPYDTDDEEEIERLAKEERRRKRRLKFRSRRNKSTIEDEEENDRLMRAEMKAQKEEERRVLSNALDGGEQRSRLLEWRDTMKMPWDILMLLGGGYALALGFHNSGMIDWATDKFASLENLPTLVLLVIICSVVMLVSEITSSIATANIVVPLAAAIAIKIHVNPLLLMLPATVSSSLAFCLPIASASNAIIFASGEIRLSEMIKPGIFVNIMGVIIVTIGTYLLLPPAFNIQDVHEPPYWATNTTRTDRFEM